MPRMPEKPLLLIRTGDIGDSLGAERVVERLQGPLLELDVAEIVVHEADEPNVVVDLLNPERHMPLRERRVRPAFARRRLYCSFLATWLSHHIPPKFRPMTAESLVSPFHGWRRDATSLPRRNLVTSEN